MISATNILLTLATILVYSKINSISAVPAIQRSRSDAALSKKLQLTTDNIITFPGKISVKCRPSTDCKIPEELNYVCGSDNKTYSNMEAFECFRKSCNFDLKIKYEGKCESKDDASEDTFATKEATKEVRDKKNLVPAISESQSTASCNPDECGCTDEFNPICGSDAITYGNKCLLECNRKCNPVVTVFHEGYCGRIFFRDGQNELFQKSKARKQQLAYNLVN